MAKLKSIVLAVGGLSALSCAALSHAATPNQTGMAMMRLNAALTDQTDTRFASGSLWNSLRKDFRMAEVNTELVRRHETKLAAGRAYFDRTINRSKPYMYHIAHEVKKRNMPAEIALLPFIESAFVTKAKSPVGASGLWQFMPATGRHYGLERTALYDGRHDVYAATDAALNYLQYLHGLFGDWSLALAAYNWGEGNLGRAINRTRAQGLEPVYENIRMPNETRNYVPKLLAVRNIVSNPQMFGLNLSEIDNKPYFKTLTLDQPADISAIARLAGISESEFLTLNPAFNAPVFIPKSNRKLLLPATAAATFEKNYRNAKPETLLSWDVYTPFSSTSLSSIAAQTGMSVAEIKRLNSMSGNTVSAGRSILVAKNSLNNSSFGSESLNLAAIDSDNSPDTYRSNMPVMQPMPDNTAALASARPATPAAAPITVARIEASGNPYSGRPQIVAAQTRPLPEPANTAAADIRIQAAQPVAAATAPFEAPTAELTAIAVNSPLPLPTQPGVAAESDDPLLALAQESTMRINAAESVRNVIAQADADNAARLRTEQAAATRAKQQQRTETRLARANTAPQTAAGSHRVVEGDTLFNISQRYNVSVADLITANNITGNNIRRGQVLKVAAAANQRSTVRNVSYTVRKGDTLNTIANRFNVDVNDIRRWNRNTRTITPGQRLKLIGS
ncbi:LysM peptidoglycan-binding domain-containing protein [Uruburuella testudinis]|uniref:LysM peptidoglycan-binding domain-containing protein n=1 Tax=Uruburuella testudinis TaxID=1282863 RepID=A0ABY4DRW6_9NEIS|nr:LysM peptidoglycan-binding domain-containing protein [Uruburuella testudinis]UOO81148.1 LysM peptidoglycan-binding domain-containing protein [Uruburuella testudinis]